MDAVQIVFEDIFLSSLVVPYPFINRSLYALDEFRAEAQRLEDHSTCFQNQRVPLYLSFHLIQVFLVFFVLPRDHPHG